MKLKKVGVLGFILVIGLFMSGCQSKEVTYGQQQIISIGQEKIYLDEMMYHVMIAEFQGKVISSYFGNEDAYWDSDYEAGVSMKDNTRGQILEDVIKYQIYYNKAKEEGLVLSEEEKEQAKQTVTSMNQNIGQEQVKRTQLSELQLEEITQKVLLARKYYEEQLKKVQVDEAEIAKEIERSKGESYKIKYIFMPSQIKNEKGQLVSLDREELDKINTKMQEERVTLQKGEAQDKIGEITFYEKDHPFGEEVEIAKQVKGLKVGEVSPVFETSKGYYVIQRLENDSSDTYEKAVEEAVQKKKEEVLKAEFEKAKEQYKITINQKEWNKVDIGKLIFTSN